MSTSRDPGSSVTGLRIARIGGVPVHVSASWLVLAAVIAVALAPVATRFSPGVSVVGAYAVGLLLAVLLAASILLHELSHAVVARRLGMPVHGITLHFLGGVTQVGEESRTPGREFVVAVVGPITSILVGLAVLATELVVRPDGLALLVMRGLAGVNLFVGVFNLLPGLPLDGGRLLRAVVWKVTGDNDRGLLVAGLTGRVVAVLALALPLLLLVQGTLTVLDLVVGVVIAAFLWQGASAAVSVARWRARMPALRAGDLARPCESVPADLSLAEALARARQSSVGGMVTTRGGGIHGVVSEEAVAATEPAVRHALTAGDVARTLEDGLVLGADLAGMDLLGALQATPATEYVVLADGALHGVLVTADVERVLRRSAP
ncbi:M50 family metallopeptidase [Nocardioidaceae bacterium]|nr:M50 family metallopeptidase [Nocardioidaceae bacterium]